MASVRKIRISFFLTLPLSGAAIDSVNGLDLAGTLLILGDFLSLFQTSNGKVKHTPGRGKKL